MNIILLLWVILLHTPHLVCWGPSKAIQSLFSNAFPTLPICIPPSNHYKHVKLTLTHEDSTNLSLNQTLSFPLHLHCYYFYSNLISFLVFNVNLYSLYKKLSSIFFIYKLYNIFEIILYITFTNFKYLCRY